MTWLEAYPLDQCPRCGGMLDPVDVDLRRHCPDCRIYVEPSSVKAEPICGERAAFCHCSEPPGHDGPHVCGRDGGSWQGTFETDSFVIIRLPLHGT